VDLRESQLTVDDGDDRVGDSNIWEKSILTNLSYLGEVGRTWVMSLIYSGTHVCSVLFNDSMCT